MSTVRQEFAQLHDVLNRTLLLLDEASALIEPAGIWPPAPTVGLIDRAKNEVLQARSNLHAARAAAAGKEAAALSTEDVVGPEPPAYLEDGQNRKRIVVRKVADVNLPLRRLLLPWKMPRIEIDVGALPPLENQRMQDRITRIRSAAEQQMLGPVAAGALILFGAFRIVAFHNPWTSTQDLKDFGILLCFGLVAWIAGRSIEIIWSRARLLRVLLRLRRMARDQGRS
ncbi:MAG: hypothetical protein WDO12_02630 [Pseudomonadota bacterium]